MSHVNVHQLSNDQLYKIRLARYKARTDLTFLAKDILGYKDVTGPQRFPFINLLQKFPMPGPQELAELDRLDRGKWVYNPKTELYSLPGHRRVLILDPRGFLKTTINAQSHTIQWILNYPDIAILMFQSNIQKAEMIIGEIKQHFQANPRFRDLFPDHCPQKRVWDWGTKGEFTTEARGVTITRKEPTLMAASIDKGSAGIHVDVMKFSDIVEPNNVKTDEQISGVIQAFGMAENLLVSPSGWIDVEGTRYDFCLAGDTKILMSDWKHKPISEIKVGDEVVGWGFEKGKRVLQRSKVIAANSFIATTKKYTFESGRSITCTPEHKFWRGKGWCKNDKNREYSEIKRLSSVRRLLIPTEKDMSHEAGWLAGFYDGEGSFQKNPRHPSGTVTITQTMHNPCLIEKTRQILNQLGFQFSESWHKPSLKGQKHWQDRCIFKINGGWRERYRFLAEIGPERHEKIAESLFAALTTTEDRIVSVEDAGDREVFFFQCETGNYIADGVCSKNSDLYGEIIKSEITRPPEEREWKIHVRGVYKRDTGGAPERFTPEELDLPYLRDENGQKISWWPERWPVFELEKRRKNPAIGEYIFACLAQDEPVLMSDWREKPIQDVRVGDEVVGYETAGRTKFVKSKVLAVHTRVAPIYRMVTESGHVSHCTADHLWYTGRKGYDCERRLGHNRKLYDLPKVGREVIRAYDAWPEPTNGDLLHLGWLAGMLDGEGHIANSEKSGNEVTITQSEDVNPHISRRIEDVLTKLKIPFGAYRRRFRVTNSRNNIYYLKGGRGVKIRLLNQTTFAKEDYLIEQLWKFTTRVGVKDRIVSFEYVGEGPVYCLTTETGNYVGSRFLSANCQQLNSPVEVGDESQVPFPVNKEYPKWISRDNFRKNVRVVHRTVTIDTAETQSDRADYSCITVTAWDTAGRPYIDDIQHGKWLPDELIKRVIGVQLRYNPLSIAIEETSFVRGLMPSIRRQIDLHGIHINFTFIKRESSVSKKERILNTLQPWYKSGEIRFLDDIVPKEELIEELRRFPKYRHDDILDTLADQFQNREWFGRLTPRDVNPWDPQKTVSQRQQIINDAFDRWLGIDDLPNQSTGGYRTPTPYDNFYAKTGGL